MSSEKNNGQTRKVSQPTKNPDPESGTTGKPRPSFLSNFTTGFNSAFKSTRTSSKPIVQQEKKIAFDLPDEVIDKLTLSKATFTAKKPDEKSLATAKNPDEKSFDSLLINKSFHSQMTDDNTDNSNQTQKTRNSTRFASNMKSFFKSEVSKETVEQQRATKAAQELSEKNRAAAKKRRALEEVEELKKRPSSVKNTPLRTTNAPSLESTKESLNQSNSLLQLTQRRQSDTIRRPTTNDFLGQKQRAKSVFGAPVDITINGLAVQHLENQVLNYNKEMLENKAAVLSDASKLPMASIQPFALTRACNLISANYKGMDSVTETARKSLQKNFVNAVEKLCVLHEAYEKIPNIVFKVSYQANIKDCLNKALKSDVINDLKKSGHLSAEFNYRVGSIVLATQKSHAF